jgi:branched-chain amino acid aminotransferase
MRQFEWVAGGLAGTAGRPPRGSYTTLRTYGGRGVLRLDQHVRRLVDSAAELGQEGTLDPVEVRRAVGAALTAAGHAESRLRLTFSPPRLFVAIEAFDPLPEASYREGVACATLPLQREHPHAKDTGFLAVADRARGALPSAAHEGLLVTGDGAILEGLSSNFFAVLEARLRTEAERVLSGVTRSLVLELASGLLPLVLEPVGVAEVPRLSEAFLTSVSRGILPVVRIDEAPVADGRPGPVSAELRRRFADLVGRELEALP